MPDVGIPDLTLHQRATLSLPLSDVFDLIPSALSPARTIKEARHLAGFLYSVTVSVCVVIPILLSLCV